MCKFLKIEPLGIVNKCALGGGCVFSQNIERSIFNAHYDLCYEFQPIFAEPIARVKCKSYVAEGEQNNQTGGRI